jgi:GNAT superfamily N-acetyltransferase
VIAREDHGRFLSTITVATGFVAPLHLLAGLVVQFEEDWQLIITQYGRAVSQRGDTLPCRTLQAFAFDCWLLWGPSIPVCTCRQWSGLKAVQYGYGDEDNSVALVFGGDDAGLRRLLASPFPDQDFAYKLSVTGRPRLGSTLNRNELCAAQQVIADRERPRLLLEHVSHRLLVGGPAEHRENRYYSAYVWMMFVLVDGAGQPLSPDRPWESLFPFFEHGNVGDARHYRFFKEQVAHKALTSIAAMAAAPGGAGARFAYAGALDDAGCGSRLIAPHPGPTMKDLLTRLLAGDEFAHLARDGHVVVPDRPDVRFSACHLPGIVEAYYEGISGARASDVGPVQLQELTRDADDLALLARFHRGVYQDEFPDPDERESLANMALALEQSGASRDAYHVVLALDARGEVVGGVIADYLAGPDAGVVEFLVVAPAWRGRGVGRLLLEDVERRLVEDARAAGYDGLACVVAEMDDPCRAAGVRDMFDPHARLSIWQRWGYRRLDFDYVQPALSAEQEPVTRLLLAARPLDPSLRQALPATLVSDIVREYVRFAMRRESPEDCEEYRQMRAALSKRRFVRTAPLARPLGPGEDGAVVIREVTGPDDPDVPAALALYAATFAPGPHRVEPAALREGLARVGVEGPGDPSASVSTYHFWTLRAGSDDPVQGLASFFTFDGAGFGGYMVLGHGLRRRGLLDTVLARMERRMVADCRGVRGWYVECESGRVARHMAEHGFHAIDVDYVPPRLPGGASPDPAGPLTLMYRAILEDPPELTGQELLEALETIFRVAYGVADPRADAAFRAVQGRVSAWPGDLVAWR